MVQYRSNFPGEITQEDLILEPGNFKHKTSCLQPFKHGNNQNEEEGHSAETLLKAS